MRWVPIRTGWPLNMNKRPCALIVFCKAPVPGRVKTRLIPELGADGAAAFFMKLARGTFETARQSAIQDIYLYCSPDTDHPFFQRCAADYRLLLRPQQGRDLGERMAGAFAGLLSRYRSAVLIGCDCPELTAADLDTAAGKLAAGSEIVLGPSEDGGYYLIGMTRDHPELFEDLQWGLPDVLVKTRERIAASGLDLAELPLRWDVDRPNDLYRFLDAYKAGIPGQATS